MDEDVSEKCKCGKESTKGCHGIRDGRVYSEYYCDGCYFKEHSKGSKDDESGISDSVQKD